jgi:hypothetical protein
VSLQVIEIVVVQLMKEAPLLADANGLSGVILVWPVVIPILALYISLAIVISRDAARHGKNNQIWMLVYLLAPLPGGLAYLIARRRWQ